MTIPMGTGDGQGAEEADDGVVIDITDAAVARAALYDQLVSRRPDGELVIDLRDEVLDKILSLAPTGRTIEPSERASGRRASMAPGLHLVAIEDDESWTRAERFVYDTYVTLGFTSENRDHQVSELAKYRDHSRFHAVINEDAEIIGTTRSIVGFWHELPIGQFTRIDYADEDPMCELSSIVVEPSLRSTGVLEHLCREGWTFAMRDGARTLAALGERWMIEYFRSVYCMPFVPAAVPQHYMGAEIVPMTMSMSPEAMAEVGRENPEWLWWNLENFTASEIEKFGYAPLTRDAMRSRVTR